MSDSSGIRRPRVHPADYGWSTFGGRWIVALPMTLYAMNEYDYALEVDFDPDTEKPICIDFNVRRREGGPPIEQESLRVPIASWIALDADAITRRDGAEYELPTNDRFSRDPAEEDLDAFCDLWTWLRLRGEPAGAVIAAKYGVKPPTTTRWIARARKLGILKDTHTRL